MTKKLAVIFWFFFVDFGEVCKVKIIRLAYLSQFAKRV